MKRFLTVVFMLGYAMVACGQQALMRHQLRYTHITVTLDSTSSKTIFIGYPDISSLNARVDTTAFGTNIPQYQRQSVVAMGHVFVGVTLDISGVEESDSLYSILNRIGLMKTSKHGLNPVQIFHILILLHLHLIVKMPLLI